MSEQWTRDEWAAQVRRHFAVEDAKVPDVPILERKWYYSLEISPGVFTSGTEFNNVHLTRSALRNVDPAGLRCLDIGCVECLVPLLLERRGADEVHAYDRLNFSERVEFVRQHLGGGGGGLGSCITAALNLMIFTTVSKPQPIPTLI